MVVEVVGRTTAEKATAEGASLPLKAAADRPRGKVEDFIGEGLINEAKGRTRAVAARR